MSTEVTLDLLELEGERVVLRRPRAADVERILRFYRENEAHFRETDPDRPQDFLTAPWWQTRVSELEQGFREDRLLHTLVFHKHDPGRVVGVVNFSQFVRGGFQSCTLGYGIAESEQGRGLMREAISVGIAHLFGALRMHRIAASYLPGNVRSAQLLARLGFVPEGYARKALLVGGEWRDLVLTSLINDDWRPPRPEASAFIS